MSFPSVRDAPPPEDSSSITEPGPVPFSTGRSYHRRVDANAVLQAELDRRAIAELKDLSSGEIVDLVLRYAVWIPLATYVRAPWIAPYAVRRIRIRTDPHAPGPKRDLWGLPDEH